MNVYPPRQIYAGSLSRRQHTWGRRMRRRRILQLPFVTALTALGLAALIGTALVTHLAV